MARSLRALAPLLRGTNTGLTVAASTLLFAGYLIFAIGNPQLDGPWRVDEGQRIAEGYFWRLIRSGDVSNPDWFRASSIRSHPPVSKYFFGAVVSLAGVPPPHDLELARAYDGGWPADTVPQRIAGEYLRRRAPARLASFVCNALSAVIIFAVALRFQGILAGALTQFLLVRHFLFGTALFYARSDALQTVCATATIIPLLLCVAAARTWGALVAASIAGGLAALAFQTRLDGGVVLLMCIAFLVAHGPRNRRAALCVVVLALAFGIASLAIYPFYWAEPRPAEGVPSVYLVHEPLPTRIVHRFALQVSDLRMLAAEVEPKWRLDSLPQRVRFAASVFASGKAGLLTLAGWCLVLALTRALPANERAIAAWAGTGIVVMALWIPLSWYIYLLIVLPAWVLGGALGFGAALRRVANGGAA